MTDASEPQADGGQSLDEFLIIKKTNRIALFECRPRRRALGTCTEEHFPIRGRLANGLGVLHGTQELLSLSSTTSLSLNGNGAGNKKQLPYLFHLLRVDGNGDVANDLLFLKKKSHSVQIFGHKEEKGRECSYLAVESGNVGGRSKENR